jgi:hypothetical protein
VDALGRIALLRRAPVLGGSAFAFGADFLEVLAECFEVRVGEIFDLNHFVARASEGMNDFIELEVNGTSVAILGVLNEEDDQKCHDSGSRIHDELPSIREMKVRAGKSPEEDNQNGSGKSPSRANQQRGAAGERVEAAVVAMAVLGDMGAGGEIPRGH